MREQLYLLAHYEGCVQFWLHWCASHRSKDITMHGYGTQCNGCARVARPWLAVPSLTRVRGRLTTRPCTRTHITYQRAGWIPPKHKEPIEIPTAVDLIKIGFIVRLIVEHYDTLPPSLVDFLDLGEVDHIVQPLHEHKVPQLEGERVSRCRHISRFLWRWGINLKFETKYSQYGFAREHASRGVARRNETLVPTTYSGQILQTLTMIRV